MVFSSLFFLFVFFPIFFGLYYLTPRRWKNTTALIGSYLFYTWGAPLVAPLLLGSSLFDYWLSKTMTGKARRTQRQILALSLVINIGLLAYFKYTNFFLEQTNHLLGLLNIELIQWAPVALPIGISFWTFQKISYMVDVYRHDEHIPPRVTDYLLYIALFPQLIAGPIVRFKEVADQLTHRVHTMSTVSDGLWRFLLGLGKKVLVADQVGRIADIIFSLPVTELTTPYAWVGAIAYAVQIYVDFSGYSDMAIGMGKMMGFTFPENFNWPYRARSFQDFWNRWHISLTHWMRDYLYIPLGGNRVAVPRMYLNLWIVFLLSGLWHGASWTFVLWGAYHGLFLSLDKWQAHRGSPLTPRVLQRPITLVLLLVGWVIFRSPTVLDATLYMKALVGFGASSSVLFASLVNNRSLAMLLGAALFFLLPTVPTPRAVSWTGPKRIIALRAAAGCALFILSAATLANSSFRAFLYFQF